jgi:hypothetical protein
VQELLGHADVVATTMNYTCLLKLGGGAVRCPIDTMSWTSQVRVWPWQWVAP